MREGTLCEEFLYLFLSKLGLVSLDDEFPLECSKCSNLARSLLVSGWKMVDEWELRCGENRRDNNGGGKEKKVNGYSSSLA